MKIQETIKKNIDINQISLKHQTNISTVSTAVRISNFEYSTYDKVLAGDLFC